MNLFNRISVATLVVVSLVIYFGPVAALAATSPVLTGASTYSIISGTTITNTGATMISGNVAISPAGGGGYTESGTTVYGVGSSLHNADGAASTAQTDNTVTFGALSAVPNAGCTVDYSGAGAIDLATRTLVPGIYCADAFALSGTLNLDDTLGSDGVWIFRSASTLITSAGVNAKVQFLHGTGFACNVWWKVGSSATIGSGTAFTGNILALTAITMGTGASLDGRAMAQTAAVTLDSNIISGPTCVSPPQGGGGGPALGSITVIKTVINDNGGTKKVSDFPLFVNNIQVASGSANSFFASNTPYAISETSNA